MPLDITNDDNRKHIEQCCATLMKIVRTCQAIGIKNMESIISSSN